MKIKTTIYLFGFFALAFLVFAAFQWLGIKTGDEAKHAERFVFPTLNPYSPKVAPDQPQDPSKSSGVEDINPDQFSRVVIERHLTDGKKPERLEFNRETVGKTGKWVLVAPVRVRTDDSMVVNLIKTLTNLEKQKLKESGRDLARLGLDKPDYRITLTRGNKEHVLSLGSTTPGSNDGVYYAISSDWPAKPFLLPKTRFDKVFEDVNGFRDKTLVTTSFGHTAVKLAGTARPAMELTKDKDTWTFKVPAVGEADLAATDELSRQLSAIRVENNDDYVADGADDAKLAQYGLTEGKAPYSFSVTLNASKPLEPATTETVLVGNADDSAVKQAAASRSASLVLDTLSGSPAAVGAYLAREKQKVEPTHYYARLGGDKTVFRLPARHLPVLQKSADDLRSKALAKVDNSRIDVIHLNTPTEKLRIYRPDLTGAASWEMFAEGRTRAAAEPQGVQTLLDAIGKIQLNDAKAFLDDDAKLKAWFGDKPIDLGLDKPIGEVSLWADGIQRNQENKPEGNAEPRLKDAVKAKPSLKLVIGRKDVERKVVYVRREVADQKAVVLAVPDPFLSGAEAGMVNQAQATPPDRRQVFSLSSLVGQGYLAYRNRTLPSYRVDQVASVEVKRPNTTYLMERSETKNEQGDLITTWKLTQPVVASTSRGVPDYLMNMVTNTSAQQLLNDKATDKDLETCGFKNPLLTLVVKTRADAKPAAEPAKDAPKPYAGGTYVYSIGNKISNDPRYPNHYYARLVATLNEGTVPDSNQFIFAVPVNYAQSLDLELRDNTLWPEEKSKPTAVTFTWNGETAEKKPFTTIAELAYANDQWQLKKMTENGTDVTAKQPKLDVNKLNSLFRLGPNPNPGTIGLNPLSVDRYWQHSGAITPSFRLDPAKTDLPPKFMATVTYADGKTRSLIVGDVMKPSDTLLPLWKDSPFYYVTTSTTPGVVGLVVEMNWTTFVASPSWLAEKGKQ
jgi:hypothetical protein